MTISTKLVKALTIAALVTVTAGIGAGCGGRQQPPSEGTCHPWREWVPPEQVDGTWHDGYCRERSSM